MNIFIYFLVSISILKATDNTNQKFFEETINKLRFGSLLYQELSIYYKLAILPIAKIDSDDNILHNLVENQLISSLVQTGYLVMEREPNAIESLIQESVYSSEESLSNAIDKYIAIDEDSKYNDDTKDSLKNLIFKEDILGNKSRSPMNSYIQFLQTHLNSVDIIIFYRILDADIFYSEIPGNKVGAIKRNGLLRINIRAEKVENGQIVYTDNLFVANSDTIQKSLIDNFNFHPKTN